MSNCIGTERLILRRFRETDAEDFAALVRDKMSGNYAAYDEQFPTDDEGIAGVLEFFCSDDGFFAVEEKKSGKPIGFVALNGCGSERNLGFCLLTEYQGKGYATEAVNAVIRYAGNTLRLQRIVSGTARLNAPAVRLLERCGFSLTGSGTGSFITDKTGKPVCFESAEYTFLLAPESDDKNHEK